MALRSWYSAYTKTPHWDNMRSARLDEAGHKCERCHKAKDKLFMHHKTYERMGLELLEDLMIVCYTCHELLHKETQPPFMFLMYGVNPPAYVAEALKEHREKIDEYNRKRIAKHVLNGTTPKGGF